MSLSLVVLAAGVGRRFGGLKQIEGIGPGGETLMDYSVYDAWRAGFQRVVFIIRPDMEADVRAQLGGRYEGRLPVIYAHQRIDDLPPPFLPPAGRHQPWGTGQAVLAASTVVDGPFAVANADDFYGAGSFELLAGFLRQPPRGDVPTYALVSFALGDTLTDAGPVARGVCRCAKDGWLMAIVETTGIRRQGTGGAYGGREASSQLLSGDTPVSMNLWGFQPTFFEPLRAGFAAFLSEHGQSTDREFYLPSIVNDLSQAQHARVRVLPARDRWCGITHPQDKARAAERIRELVAHGDYPARLWG